MPLYGFVLSRLLPFFLELDGIVWYNKYNKSHIKLFSMKKTKRQIHCLHFNFTWNILQSSPTCDPFSNASVEYSRFIAPSGSHSNFLILIYIFGASLEAKLCMATRRQQWPNALILLTFNQARAADTAEKRDCAAAALRPRLKQTKDALRWQRRQLQNILHFAVEFSIGSGYEFPFPFSFPLERDLFTCNLLPYTTSATHQHHTLPPSTLHPSPPRLLKKVNQSKAKQRTTKTASGTKSEGKWTRMGMVEREGKQERGERGCWLLRAERKSRNYLKRLINNHICIFTCWYRGGRANKGQGAGAAFWLFCWLAASGRRTKWASERERERARKVRAQQRRHRQHQQQHQHWN